MKLTPFEGYEAMVECRNCNDGGTILNVWVRDINEDFMISTFSGIVEIDASQPWKVAKWINENLHWSNILNYVMEYKKSKIMLTRKDCLKCL